MLISIFLSVQPLHAGNYASMIATNVVDLTIGLIVAKNPEDIAKRERRWAEKYRLKQLIKKIERLDPNSPSGAPLTEKTFEGVREVFEELGDEGLFKQAMPLIDFSKKIYLEYKDSKLTEKQQVDEILPELFEIVGKSFGDEDKQKLKSEIEVFIEKKGLSMPVDV